MSILTRIACYLFKVIPESEAQKMINAEGESYREKLHTAELITLAAERARREAMRERDAAILERDRAVRLERAAGEELREQVELNAELLQQGFGIEVDARRHSNMVDAARVQVLTQLTMRSLDVRHGLVNALMSPFAYNVARHLANKLKASGSLKEGRDAIEVGTEKLITRTQLALPKNESS